MLKQLIFIFSLAIVFSAFTFAQEQPETTKSDKKECSKDSKGCCGSQESQSSMQMEESNETASVQIWNKVCPVKGEEIDADAPTVEYNGKTIGFCCPGCDSKFQKDPEKYMKNLNEDGTKFIGKS
jgi:YHS domain-containing protein